MKKNSILMLVMTLIMALGMSQSVMAKEKKVKYLGHNYRGEVNDQKVPAGKGVMNVHGLMIEGDFSDHSVSNVEVWRTTYMGTSNTTFSGTITYDESENIVLKAGGVISTKYYYLDPNYPRGNGDYLKDDEPSFVKDTLKEDKIVNSSTFETKKLTISFNPPQDKGFVFDDVKELNVPTLCASYTVDLTHAVYYKGNKVDMDVFAAISHYNYRNELIEPIKVEGYKDNEGRVWDYIAKPQRFEGIRVKYPNGSYLAYEVDRYNNKKTIAWGIHYPNGKIVKTNWPPDNTDPVYNMGDFSFKTNYSSTWPSTIIGTFAKNINKEKFTAPSCREITITSDSLDFEKLSNSEMEKFIREDVIPYIENGNTSEYTTPNGKYEKGVFTSNEQAAAAKAKRDAAEKAALNKSIANFKKKYGFDPSVNDVKYIVKVGRNLLGILDARKEWVDEYGDDRNAIVTIKLANDLGASKCYQFYWYNTAYYMGYFWTRNNVITSIHWGR
ncbi:hypothetical protein L6475_13775 [Prevotella sp. E9-3]|uniref:hypothetical protein n=1 Tax=Prevotella sp. E9-3 TaxID=2913621 RepID=UPI001EDA1838|nr:hypothetical protein [Prevotella sp. E9-3]UKK48253.1 hypothetical protein L6475_13775 [Prevotella sp. E9-3]